MDDRLARRALARRRHDLGYVLSIWPIGCAFAALLAYCLDSGGEAAIGAIGGAGYAAIAAVRTRTGHTRPSPRRFIVKKSTAVNIWTATVSLVIGVTAGIVIEATMDAMDRTAGIRHLRADASPDGSALADSALLCVNGREYLVTGVSAVDHRMVPLRKQTRPVPCTGGVSLVDGGATIATATPMPMPMPTQTATETGTAPNTAKKLSGR